MGSSCQPANPWQLVGTSLSRRTTKLCHVCPGVRQKIRKASTSDPSNAQQRTCPTICSLLEGDRCRAVPMLPTRTSPVARPMRVWNDSASSVAC